ncbi:MAG TPA: O-antigen ligase family protein [Solirubrobacteraceae bacterium]|nr:O-antigen ligase family protein [Solirubrobacteraceae bacterium]
MSSSVAPPPSAPVPASPISTYAPTPEPVIGQAPDGPPRGRPGWQRLAASWWPTLLVAAVLCALTFVAGAGLTNGGLNLGPMTGVELGLTLGCGLTAAAALALAPPESRLYGRWPAMLLVAFAALSALSVLWSVQPDASWQDASRLFAYGAVMGLAVLLARVAPGRWSAVLGGVVLASAIVCGYALLTKVFPNDLGGEQITYYARLREPYGYWNATGLAAALGAIGCVWLGARRSGHALVSALAFPALGVMLVTLLLAYSRGALAVLVLGLALWFCMVPLRLRGALVLLTAAFGAGVVVAWDFATPALTTNTATLAQRILAGHQLGVLLAAMVVALTVAGLGVGFVLDSRRLVAPARRRVGAALIGLPVLAVLALVVALAASQRGLYGTVSSDLGSLTNPNATVPSNGPNRLTALASARAAYWKEALEIFADHPAVGVGAAGYETARLRYRSKPVNVAQAHGFVVQTLADLGIVGLALVLVLLGAWLVAAGRSTHPFNRRWRRWRWRALEGPATHYSPERVGLLTMICVVVTFGIHSLVDWTWYSPGLACAALLCAGWVAGRGPLTPEPEPEPAGAGAGAGERGGQPATAGGRPSVAGGRLWLGVRLPSAAPIDPLRGAAAIAIVVAALLAAWAEWQPQRSAEASNEALALAGSDPAGALSAAMKAVSRDPLSAEALITLAAVQQGTGDATMARATYQRAVRLQPSNPLTWEALGEYDLRSDRPAAALRALRAAVYLNPQAVDPRAEIASNEELLTLQDDYLQALRASAAAAPRPGASVGHRADRRGHG